MNYCKTDFIAMLLDFFMECKNFMTSEQKQKFDDLLFFSRYAKEYYNFRKMKNVTKNETKFVVENCYDNDFVYYSVSFPF